ncbi:MAG TPA: hypothetical protein VM737_03100 [Gemmatimonadota bacterium]|nr:hypothetical protein [Gemmatimonadota bacterium]
MRASALLLAGGALLAAPLEAQEHEPHAPGMEAAPATMRSGPLGIPHTREGSGTAWLPDASPVYAWHSRLGDWETMVHGQVYLQYIDEGSDRGDQQFGSINWIMGMLRREAAGGHLVFRGMVSLEPLTVGTCGYPNLLATGELCDGEPLHDRQHPHDLFMELAASYERELGEAVALQLYGGPVGEPALGPVAFPHRLSAFPNPYAPIGHHWLDSTHIAFGVATAGVFGRRWKLEGSLFNGREPDEDRYGIDVDALDSYSGRLWFLPSDRWALQVSAGHLNEAEPPHGGGPGEPAIDVTRVTASATHHRLRADGGLWATTAAWGRNTEEGESSNALMLDSSFGWRERHIVFGRAERVEKSADDLDLLQSALLGGVFDITRLSLGYARQFDPVVGILPGIGASVSLSLLPEELELEYGDDAPVGFALFATLRPAPMAHGAAEVEPEAEHEEH